VKFEITTQRQLRKQFWIEHPVFAHQAREAGVISKPQNFHRATLRCAFVDWVDSCERDGRISADLANRATL